ESLAVIGEQLADVFSLPPKAFIARDGHVCDQDVQGGFIAGRRAIHRNDVVPAHLDPFYATRPGGDFRLDLAADPWSVRMCGKVLPEILDGIAVELQFAERFRPDLGWPRRIARYNRNVEPLKADDIALPFPQRLPNIAAFGNDEVVRILDEDPVGIAFCQRRFISLAQLLRTLHSERKAFDQRDAALRGMVAQPLARAIRRAGVDY